jgi:hypothetical protein
LSRSERGIKRDGYATCGYGSEVCGHPAWTVVSQDGATLAFEVCRAALLLEPTPHRFRLQAKLGICEPFRFPMLPLKFDGDVRWPAINRFQKSMIKTRHIKSQPLWKREYT